MHINVIVGLGLAAMWASVHGQGVPSIEADGSNVVVTVGAGGSFKLFTVGGATLDVTELFATTMPGVQSQVCSPSTRSTPTSG